ncbi:DUF4113 domain-containing protein [Methylobacterium mesophilicum]
MRLASSGSAYPLSARKFPLPLTGPEFSSSLIVNVSSGLWSTKFEMRSPRYTTRIDELQVIAVA